MVQPETLFRVEGAVGTAELGVSFSGELAELGVVRHWAVSPLVTSGHPLSNNIIRFCRRHGGFWGRFAGRFPLKISHLDQ